MADVAVAAGVSRQTLYSEFGTRAEFLAAAAENPLVQEIVAPDGDGARLALITTRAAPRFEGVGAHLTGVFVATWPQFSRREARAGRPVSCACDQPRRAAAAHAEAAASLVTGLLAPYRERAFQPSAA